MSLGKIWMQEKIDTVGCYEITLHTSGPKFSVEIIAGSDPNSVSFDSKEEVLAVIAALNKVLEKVK